MAEAVIPASLRIQPPPPELAREPLVTHQRSIGWISDAVAGVAEGKTPKWWWYAFIPSVTMFSLLGVMILYLMSKGVGLWGLGQPVMWGWAIVNFGWWLLPLPNANSIWPQFRSPLIWDVFAVSTYFTVSLLFWYMGLIPDLAVMRDRAKTKIRKFAYGLFALGWTGSNRHWSNYERAYLILAGLSTPLVLSVHSIVSLDFSVSQLPGWHTTIFPPYFVAGAVFSGFGMVLTLLIPLRKICKLEDIITVRHVELMCKVTLATGSIVGYAYGMEFFWFKRIRTNMIIVFILSIFVNIGMWFERFVIVVTSLHREFLPSNWSYYSPTWVDICTYLGTFGLFFTFFLLFIRFVPLVAIAEVKAVTPQADPHHPLGGAQEGGHS